MVYDCGSGDLIGHIMVEIPIEFFCVKFLFKTAEATAN